MGKRNSYFFNYDNTPMQYTARFNGCKKIIFGRFVFNIFSYSCFKHTLWVLTRTHHLRFRAKIKKNMYILVNPSFTLVNI